MKGLIEIAELAERPVVAEHLAVIRGEDHDRVAVPALGGEAIKQPADLPVDLGDHAVVDGAHRAEVVIGPVGDATGFGADDEVRGLAASSCSQ